jgi:Protein of unknown function (DUF3072)
MVSAFSVNKPATSIRREMMASENLNIGPLPCPNTEKVPDDWVSGDEPMTGAQ